MTWLGCSYRREKIIKTSLLLYIVRRPASGRNLKCSVCELPQDIREELDAMMFLTMAGNTKIGKHFRQVLKMKPPSDRMLNRHRDNNHHMKDGQLVEVPESVQFQKISRNNGDIDLYDRVALNITRTMLPQLAVIPERLEPLREKQELYVLTKSLLAEELENMEIMTQIYEHETKDGIKEIPIKIVSKNAKDLIKMANTQLGGIEESLKDIKGDDNLIQTLTLALMDAIQGDQEMLDKIADRVYATSAIMEDADYTVSEDDN